MHETMLAGHRCTELCGWETSNVSAPCFQNKANVNAKNNIGETALHVAADSGYLEIMEELLQN